MKRLAGIVFVFLVLISTRTHAENIRAFVTAPTVCHRLERVDGDKVYFVSPERNTICPQVAVSREIVVDKSIKRVKIFIDGEFAYEEDVKDIVDTNTLRDFDRKKEQFIKEIEKEPFWNKNKYEKQGQMEAQKLYEVYNSEEFQLKIQSEMERLKRDVFPGQVRDYNEYYSQIQNKNTASTRKEEPFYGSKTIQLSPDERIYVFISSSVPVETLRNYARDIDRIGSPNIKMVMRGFVGGMKYIKPTMEYLSDILKKDRLCDFRAGQKCEVYGTSIYIDPLLFRAYNIKEVPAFVYVKGLKVMDPLLSEGITDNVTSAQATVLYGDVSLEYAVEMFRRQK